MTTTVCIVQRRLPHYRVPLFELMRGQLATQGVHLRVLHGDPSEVERSKNDSGSLAWAEHLPTRYLAGGRICWQPFAARCRDSDLVVVTQENKLVNNLGPLLNPWRRTRLAFWGHGRNMQAQDPGAWVERFKRWTTRRVDWWFAYTQLSTDLVVAAGFPVGRVTVLNNSIDTSALRADVQQAMLMSRTSLRQQFGLGTGPIAVFIGSLYADKRIRWLLDAAKQFRRQLPGFQLVVAGAGPLQADVAAASAEDPAIVYVGSVHGARKAQLLACADIMLNPGLVGLGILDAFVAGLPMITTDCGLHSPEIAYLRHGHNGLMTADDLAQYVDACVRLLEQHGRLQAMQEAARISGTLYSLEQMAARFSEGILRALAAPPLSA